MRNKADGLDTTKDTQDRGRGRFANGRDAEALALNKEKNVLNRLRQRTGDQSGFTLIELLVVILIIGILAAIAIPSFLSQRSKAYDASAKALVGNVETAAETIGTDNNGSYTAVSPTELHAYEGTIKIAAGNEEPYVTTASGTATTWTATIKAAHTEDLFTIERNASGELIKSCTLGSGSNAKDCAGW